MIKVLNMGVYGVFLGTSVSTLVTTIVVPHAAFKYILRKNLSKYFKLYFKYAILTILFATTSVFLFKVFYTQNSFLNVVIGCITSIGVMGLGTVLFLGRSDEFSYVFQMIKGFIKKRGKEA